MRPKQNLNKFKNIELIVPAKIMHGKIIYIEACSDQGIQVWHNRSTQIHHHLPVIHIYHLTCEVLSVVFIKIHYNIISLYKSEENQQVVAVMVKYNFNFYSMSTILAVTNLSVKDIEVYAHYGGSRRQSRAARIKCAQDVSPEIPHHSSY